MRTRQVLSVVFIMLAYSSFSYGWQNQPPVAVAGNQHPAGLQPGVAQQQYQGIPQYGGSPQSPPAYQPSQAGNTGPDGYPQYPYPLYHNPYYPTGGMTPRDMLSHAVEWLFSLPANVAEHVSNFVDSRFFPQSPATHGGQSQSHVQGQHFPADNPGPPQQAHPSRTDGR